MTGNIAPGEIQIDPSANLYPGNAAEAAAALNAGALLDWVLSTTGNTGTTGCLDPATAIASCVQPGVTGAVGGAGTWNGIRIVDGIGAADQDIFVQGGKENDVSTWTIEPGNVGGPKFDLTQAYLANNQENLYFGMERRGNNGTTAFDFEFNQFAPVSVACPEGDPLIPCRTVDDVLFTFEMQGAGNSGSAVPHVYLWDGTTYVEETPLPDGVFSSINTNTTTDAAPWGRVDSQGNWVLTDFGRFELAEATAPMELLTGDAAQCGGTAYVQVRTRSSATDNSDLKDTSKIFEFQFNSLSADATLTGSCDGTATFSATAKDPDGNSITTGLHCAWVFTPDVGQPITVPDDCDGSFSADQLEGISSLSATVTVTADSTGTCDATDSTGPVDILRPIQVDITPKPAAAECKDPNDAPNALYSDIELPPGTVITYEANVTGGDGDYSYIWNIEGCGDEDTCDVSDTALCSSLDVFVMVDDDSDSCPGATSETETYTKITFVTSIEQSGEGGGDGTGGAGGGGADGSGGAAPL